MCDTGAMGAMERIPVISALLQLYLGTKRQGVGEGNVLSFLGYYLHSDSPCLPDEESFCSYLLLIVAKL